MNYEVKRIISNEDRAELIALYNSIPSTKAHQDYNLFTVGKRPIGPSTRNLKAFDKLDDFAKRPPYSQYFVMYEEGSFTKFHTDDDDNIGLTIVTLLDEVDLVGGETLALVEYNETPRSSNTYRKGDIQNHSRVIPKIVRSEVGDSMIYDHKLTHGVAQVEKGKRLVLVQWYWKDEETKRGKSTT